MTPYASAVERARVLYRIPTAPEPGRTLEICHRHEPLLAPGSWRGLAQVWRLNDALELPLAEGAFDRIILHRTLDDLAAPSPAGAAFEPARFLRAMADLLAPGGLVAGCVQNRGSLAAIGRRLWSRARHASAADEAPHSMRGLSRALALAGFDQVRFFTLVPNSEAPLRLIDVDPRVSRRAFRLELQYRQRHLPWLAPGARRLAVELGLYPRLEPSLFFWAFKRC